MAIPAFRKGFVCLSKKKIVIVLLSLSISAHVWFMPRDPSAKCLKQNVNKISKYSRYGIVASVENIGANKTVTEKPTDSSAQSMNKVKASEVVPTRNLYMSKTEGYEAAQHGNKSSVGMCSMEKYIHVKKRQCQLPFDELSSKISNDPQQKGRNSLTYGSNLNDIKHLNVTEPKNSECDIDNVFFNCDALRYSYLYGKGSVTEEEELFPLAFAMKIHQGANQAHRLLRYIYQKHNMYCIHIDTKASVDVYSKFRQIGQCFDNIHVIEDRANVVYSTIRLVEAEFKCMEAMVKHGHKWKYYLNLSGQEFMLRTNLEIVMILKLINGRNEIESRPFPSAEFHRFENRTIINGNNLFVTHEKKTPFSENIEIRKGSAYGMFSRKFVEFVLTDKLVKKFYDWLNDTYNPEEMIRATLDNIPETPGGHVRQYYNETFLSRGVKWKTSYEKCGGNYVRDVCVYGTRDIPWLLSNRNVVANKFYENYQSLALDCVENEMYLRFMAGRPSNLFDLTYYSKVLGNTEDL